MTEVTIRSAAPDDAAPVHAVICAAFDDGGQVADLWADVERRGHGRGSILALRGSEVVGHVGLSHAWLDARARLVDVWILSPLSTLPSQQRLGVGSTLVQAAIDATRAAGVPALFLEGSPAYYGRRGFETASARGFLPASARTPDLAFQVAMTGAWEEWMSGAVVYHDVWWEHDAAGLRDPVLAEMERTLGEGRTHVR